MIRAVVLSTPSVSMYEVADRFGVTYGAVRMLCRWETWRHIDVTGARVG